MIASPSGSVTVTVPATSANLGPGFDALGLALDLRDRVTLVASPPDVPGVPTTVCHVTGEGAGEVPGDDRNLVVATLRTALADLVPDVVQPSVRLACTNAVPHGRGLGSSAAAVVAGLALAWELARLAGGPATRPASERVSWLVEAASAQEGHGDNAAAAVLGGVVVCWDDGVYRAEALHVDESLEVVSAVPAAAVPTRRARAVLGGSVTRSDAVFTASRTALLVLALGGRRDLLMAATADRIHQDAREPVMPATLDLVRRLRSAGHPAVVSGAGPSVLTLGVAADVVAAHVDAHWTVRQHRVGRGVHVEAAPEAASTGSSATPAASVLHFSGHTGDLRSSDLS